MNHCGKFGYALWASAANLFTRNGPLRGVKPHSKKICDYFRGMGSCTGFDYALAPNQSPERIATQKYFISLLYPLKGHCY
jgi:hypothetical protein